MPTKQLVEFTGEMKVLKDDLKDLKINLTVYDL